MLDEIIRRIHSFEREAHLILSRHETAPSRVVLLEQSYDKLSGLSIVQDELFRQALRCVESGLFRAAHVMAWAGFMDYLENRAGQDGFVKLQRSRPKWRIESVQSLREQAPEYQLIEAFSEIGLLPRSERRALQGLLNKRNECAHPSDYFPGLNETLGFVSELLRRIEMLNKRTV